MKRVEQMDVRQADKEKQQRVIRSFYKEFLSWRTESVGNWIGAGFCQVFFWLCIAVPFQEVIEEGQLDRIMILMGMALGWLPSFLYIMPYITYKESGQDCSIVAKLKYLPVDIREIQKMRVIYLTKFIVKLFPMSLVIQLLTTWYSYGEISWMNICYVIVAAGLWPWILNAPVAMFSRRYQ